MGSFSSRTIAGGALLLGLALGGCRDTASPETDAEVLAQGAGASVSCNMTAPPAPGDPLPDGALTGGLPCDAVLEAPFDLANLQLGFDFNSWVTFAALNQADASGRPMWLGWQDLGSLMLPGGATPPAFGSSSPPPAICEGATSSSTVLKMISKTPVTPVASISGEPLNTGPLIDQNGNYARYQILVNEPMYDYIVNNSLYSKAGQKAWGDQPIAFPSGSNDDSTIGAIALKVSWKVIAGDDDPDSFQTVDAFVYTPAQQGSEATCEQQTLGLVGMHIVHKTKGAPQWLWGTFEHKANVPDSAVTSGSYNFYDPSCTDCEVNAQPPQPWNASIEPFPGGFRSQIVRATDYPQEAIDSAARWNPLFQQALGSNVLANYELVTTQWPADASSPTDPNGDPFPLFAANSTLETYVQGNVPQASSTCMGCHGNATDTAGTVSDFSYVLEQAQ